MAAAISWSKIRNLYQYSFENSFNYLDWNIGDQGCHLFILNFHILFIMF